MPGMSSGKRPRECSGVEEAASSDRGKRLRREKHSMDDSMDVEEIPPKVTASTVTAPAAKRSKSKGSATSAATSNVGVKSRAAAAQSPASAAAQTQARSASAESRVSRPRRAAAEAAPAPMQAPVSSPAAEAAPAPTQARARAVSVISGERNAAASAEAPASAPAMVAAPAVGRDARAVSPARKTSPLCRTAAMGKKSDVPALADCNSATSNVRNVALNGMLLLAALLWAWAVSTFTVFVVSGTRAAMVVNGVGGGGSPDEAIARSLVRETHEMRSLWNVVVEYRQRLTDDQAMDEEVSATVVSLNEGMADLGDKMGIYRQQVESSVASRGSREMALSHLYEVEQMAKALSEANRKTSESVAAGEKRMTGAERGYPNLEGVDAAPVDLTDGTEVSMMASAISRQEMEEFVQREVEIFASGGMQDYASLAGGASVVNGRGLTSPAMTRERVAEEALSASTLPGHCFAFAGGSGKLTVQLGGPLSRGSFAGDDLPQWVDITHISIAHAPVIVVPSAAASAPLVFRVLGWDTDPASSSTSRPKVLLNRGKYSVDADAPSAQLFEVSTSPTPVGWVTLEIESNHGAEWTCLYGFRVHGREVV